MLFRYHGLLLVVFLLLCQYMGNSHPVPAGHSHDCSWGTMKHHTRNLYELAMTLYNPEEAIKNVENRIPRIHCHHKCGPEHLVSNEKTCLKRIFHVLSYYQSVLSTLNLEVLDVSKQQSIGGIKKTISVLLPCLQKHGYEDTHLTAYDENDATDQFVIDAISFPLVSVTSLIARVFSPGNPNHHTVA